MNAFKKNTKHESTAVEVPVVEFIGNDDGTFIVTLPMVKETSGFLRYGGKADEGRESSNISLYYSKSDDENAGEVTAWEVTLKPIIGKKEKAPEKKKSGLSRKK